MTHESLPTTRADAIKRSASHYFTGVPCPQGHTAPRSTKWKFCVECNRAKAAKVYDDKTPEERKNTRRAQYEKHGEKERETMRRYSEGNPEKRREAQQRYTQRRKDRISETARRHYLKKRDSILEYCASYRRANPAKYSALAAKRRAALLQATPVWLTEDMLDQIEAIYIEADRLTDETGIDHHVDHIVPLQGKNVCGLHVPWNLRPLPAEENMRKGNKVIELNEGPSGPFLSIQTKGIRNPI